MEGTPTIALGETEVSNSTVHPLYVRVFPVLLTQQRFGPFAFDRDPTLLARAERTLSVTPTAFVLPPHSSRTEHMTWRRSTSRQAIVAGIVYEAHARARPGTLQTIERLLSVNVLTPPSARPAKITVSGLRIEQIDGSRLRASFAVHNSGGRVALPRRLRLSIQDRSARPIESIAIPTAMIAPGATREFSAEVPDRGRPGRFLAHAEAQVGAGPIHAAEIFYRLGAGGALPTPLLRAGTITATGVVGGQATVVVPVSNVGTESARGRIRFDLYRLVAGLASGEQIATVTTRSTPLAPGAKTLLRAHLGHLLPRSYEIVATPLPPFSSTQPATVDFQARRPTDSIVLALRWARHRALTLILALALALSLLALAILARHTQAIRVGSERTRGSQPAS